MCPLSAPQDQMRQSNPVLQLCQGIIFALNSAIRHTDPRRLGKCHLHSKQARAAPAAVQAQTGSPRSPRTL